uniref:Uncharacterized protein n=1 Tax=Romanomermis culicivorax TaxID=13658 RepID=A0A915IV86_ROMCU
MKIELSKNTRRKQERGQSKGRTKQNLPSSSSRAATSKFSGATKLSGRLDNRPFREFCCCCGGIDRMLKTGPNETTSSVVVCLKILCC